MTISTCFQCKKTFEYNSIYHLDIPDNKKFCDEKCRIVYQERIIDQKELELVENRIQHKLKRSPGIYAMPKSAEILGVPLPLSLITFTKESLDKLKKDDK